MRAFLISTISFGADHYKRVLDFVALVRRLEVYDVASVLDGDVCTACKFIMMSPDGLGAAASFKFGKALHRSEPIRKATGRGRRRIADHVGEPSRL